MTMNVSLCAFTPIVHIKKSLIVFLLLIGVTTILFSAESDYARTCSRNLSSGNAQTKIKAAYALSRIGDMTSIMPLRGTLRDPDNEVKWAAAFALGKLGDRSGVSILLTTLSSPAGDKRIAAAAVLAALKEQDALPQLLLMAKDSDADIRWHALAALGRINDKSVIPSLIRAMQDDDWYIRDIAARSIDTMGERRLLLVALQDANKNLRWSAINALGDSGDTTVIPLYRPNRPER